MEVTLNSVHPYEYDPRLSAYEGVVGQPFDFMRHPIAPAGSKVLTWDSPDTRGSWADHGTDGIYVGPAMDHFRAFRIWVQQNSAMRVSATVWWFIPKFVPDDHLLTLQDTTVSYPPTRDRSHPRPDGSDLLGRFFVEPDLGVCCITRLGPITHKQLASRAQRLAMTPTNKPISLGAHHTLYYQCVQTKEEFYSSVDEVSQWIQRGPLLRPPVDSAPTNLHVTSPPFWKVSSAPTPEIPVPNATVNQDAAPTTTIVTDDPTTEKDRKGPKRTEKDHSRYV